MKVSTINDFLFADDRALNAASEANMQHSVDKFVEACNNFSLMISTKKTEVLYQLALGNPYVEPTITVNGQRLNLVDKCTYLGSTLSRSVIMEDELNALSFSVISVVPSALSSGKKPALVGP